MTKPDASLGSVLAFVAIAALLAALGCNAGPAREPAKAEGGGPTGAPTPAASSPSPGSAGPGTTASGSAGPKPAAAPGACASDDDCRTFSSYCADAPCACRVLAKGAADPRCAGASVNCFADPCMNKTARCQGGACVLTPR